MIRQAIRLDEPRQDLLAAAHSVIDADARGEAAPALDPSVRAAMIQTIAATHKISAADLGRQTDTYIAAYVIALHNRIASKLK